VIEEGLEEANEYADDAVATHNNSTTAHSDIRQAIDALSSGSSGGSGESGSGGISPEYTYIVDSDQKLADWSNNVRTDGQDYTSVLIVGTRTLNKSMIEGDFNNLTPMIDLTTTNTKRITGVVGSVLNLTTSAKHICGIKGHGIVVHPDFENPCEDCNITGVTLNIDFGEHSSCFYRCTNLTNCTGVSDGKNGEYSGGSGFSNCINLVNCTGKGTGGEAGGNFGFSGCFNLVNCTGIGEGENGMYSSNSGFSGCFNLTNCKGTGASANAGYGFQYCTNLANCTGTGEGEGEGVGFYYCVNFTNCIGTGTSAGSEGYGFFGCQSMTLNKPGTTSSTGATYFDCYADSGTSYPVADTPSGGFNKA
jgi:hypothetical protein